MNMNKIHEYDIFYRQQKSIHRRLILFFLISNTLIGSISSVLYSARRRLCCTKSIA